VAKWHHRYLEIQLHLIIRAEYKHTPFLRGLIR